MRITRRGFVALVGSALALGPGAARRARAQEHARAIHHATRNTLGGAVGVRLRRRFGGSPETAKAWEGRERIGLPEASRTPARSLAEALEAYAPALGFAGAQIDAAALARLLHFSWGVTGASPRGEPRRAAPSAGALYAGEVYVVAERVAGLAPGVYAFAPLEGRLVVLRRGAALDAVAAALESPARAEGAAAALLLTNVFARYRFRYANRGYRYALIDSGHIGENARLVATSAGIAEWGPLRFHDERLNDLVGADGIEEAVCAVHLVGVSGAPPRTDAATAPLVERHRSGRALPAAADDAPERYHARTQLVAGAAAAPPRPVREDADARPLPDTSLPRIALPSPPAPRATVEAAIGARRSAHHFSSAPLPASQLGFVLDAACGHARLERAPGVALRLFVHRADGVAAGLYAFDRDARALVPLRRAPLADALVDACLGQRMAGQAAVGVAMVGAIEAAAARRGDRAYRDLCLECGAIAQRIYLAAEALGLAARNLAAYTDERMNELAGVDGRREAVLHLTMLGPGA